VSVRRVDSHQPGYDIRHAGCPVGVGQVIAAAPVVPHAVPRDNAHFMSVSYISMIPTDVDWQPTGDPAAEVGAHVARVFADPDGMQEITVDFHDRITAVDAGENIQQITCPRCNRDIPLEWYRGLIEQTLGEFDSLDVTVPCCHTLVTLDTLRLDWPSGFARFEIAVVNPVRAEYEFSDEELDMIAAILGHPVRQILAHI
jgi:hypothetical protein